MRAAVTGWALRTPLGDSPTEVIERLLTGQRAAVPNPRFVAETYPCPLAASIPGEPKTSPHSRILRRLALFGLEVSHAAMATSQAPRGPRLGVFAAMGGLRANWDELLPVLSRQNDELRDGWLRGLKDLHPFWMLRHLSNNAHALLAQDLGARGDGVTFAGATAGAMAISAATAALAEGAIDAALVFAYDSLLEPEQLIALAACGALSSATLRELQTPYAEPSTHAICGGVPGEAAAALLLEREDQDDRSLAFVEAADSADGEKGLATMATVAAVAARIAQEDRVIDGCALADPQRDQEERQQLSLIIDPAAQLLAVQSATGFLGAATSVVQTIVLGSLLRAGRLPEIPFLHHAAPGPLTPLTASVSTDARSALGVSLGAPGLAAAVRVSLPPTIGTGTASVLRSRFT